MAASLDFPNSPTYGQLFPAPNGVAYQWDGAVWVVQPVPDGGGSAGPGLWTQDAANGFLKPIDFFNYGVLLASGKSIQWADPSAQTANRQTGIKADDNSLRLWTGSAGMLVFNSDQSQGLWSVNAATGMFGIGPNYVALPTKERLEVQGGVLMGAALGTTDGTLQYAGGKFQGRVGGAWVDIPGASTNYWTDTGTALTPLVATRQVYGPGDVDGYCFILGQRTIKSRLRTGPASDWVTWTMNRGGPSAAQDDTSKASWSLRIGLDTDDFEIERTPPGPGTTRVLSTLSGTGALTLVPADTSTGGAILSTYSYGAVGNNSLLSTHAAYRARAGGAAVQVTDWLAGFDLYAAYGTNTYRRCGQIAWQAIENHGTGSGTDFFCSVVSAGGTTLGVNYMRLSTSGDFTISGSTAIKATGSTWSQPSDPRLKSSMAPYMKGLPEVCQLEPIIYELNANPGVTCYGFDASQVEPIYPECVSRMTVDIEGTPTEVRSLDINPILVSLINAVKELQRRLR